MSFRFLVLITLLLQSTAALASADTPYFSGHTPSLAQITAAQQQAQRENKLLMVILGADWCHDSRALMQNFTDETLHRQLAERFVMVRVDVSYFDQGDGVTEHFQQPTFYGTPTVMIIDPHSGQVTNKADWQHWTNAASYSSADYQAYFLEQSFVAPPQASSPWQQQVTAFEQAQAKRVEAGFAAVGPLLKTYIESDRTEGAAAFSQLWRELGKFRNQVFNDVQRLRALEEPVALPEYPAQSWEVHRDD
ncbi:thioredoxin family protein [Pseudidiomarina sediminum]|uniref:thioredoxin family protein n=1 Tax=Pseudidiomarina sediminum TaxID=431675 RepID=UPI001C95C2E4|nr:thioredoxin family protein [Pseudidiomarina sediminum]MBY6064172.1 thioredoxin family protein [Pseudidiomarina sediminum]